MVRSAVKTCRWCRPAPAPAAAPAAPALSAQAEARRDYELALQIGNKSALNAFLAQYPDGFYASLAKLQLDKIAAEETRVAATEKARLAEQERARLAAEGAQKSQQAKAEAEAKAAEQARIAAEKAKQVAQDQAAAAEQKRVAAESAAADKASAPAPADKDKAVNVAALAAGPPQADVTKSVQAELRRVGCLTGNADGNWNNASQRSLTQFNRYAGTRLDTKVASVDTLDTIKLKSSRVCPLVCEHGFQADGDRCTKITCAEGSFLNDDNECEKRRAKKPVATRERPESRRVSEARPVPQATKRVFITRSQTPGGAGMSSTGQPLTGEERQWGCNSHGSHNVGRVPVADTACDEQRGPGSSLSSRPEGAGSDDSRPGRQVSDRTPRDIDHQRDQRGVEHERDDAVHGRGAADDLVGDADIGNLRGHADHEREVDEVPVIRLGMRVAARKLQAAGLAAAVEIVRVVQRKGGVNQSPMTARSSP